LQLHQFGCVFGRQRVGNIGEQLRDFHQRALEPAEGRGKRCGIGCAVAAHTEKALACDFRRDTADIGADPRIARGSRADAVTLGIFRSFSQEPCLA
jgi:hypothetical protein